MAQTNILMPAIQDHFTNILPKFKHTQFFSCDMATRPENAQNTPLRITEEMDLLSEQFDTEVHGVPWTKLTGWLNVPLHELFCNRLRDIYQIRNMNACIGIPFWPLHDLQSASQRATRRLYKTLACGSVYHIHIQTTKHTFFPETTQYKAGRGKPPFAIFTFFWSLDQGPDYAPRAKQPYQDLMRCSDAQIESYNAAAQAHAKTTPSLNPRTHPLHNTKKVFAAGSLEIPWVWPREFNWDPYLSAKQQQQVDTNLILQVLKAEETRNTHL